jgi:DNA-binding CsgD family transcriptional regulator
MPMHAWSQNKSGIPKIVHYNRSDFKADPQFWTMCENDDGALIFGNNDGALIFDGEHWKKVFLPNNSSIRSLVKTKEGKVYAGGYNELGTLQKNKYGNYFYKSLLSEFHLNNKNIENLWQVHQLRQLIIYRSFTELIIINGSTVSQVPANKSFVYSEKVNDNYFVQDTNFGIYKLDVKTMTLQLVFEEKSILNEEVAAILPNTDSNAITLITKSGTVYSGDFNTKAITKKFNLFDGIKKDQVTFGILDSNNDYLIGTRSSKVIKIAKSGIIQNNTATFSGLSNATIHFLFQTKNHNTWVLQNNGLSFLDYKSPFVAIFDQASIYDILIKDQVIYTATNNGVYFANQHNETLDFKKIEELQGQSWSIQNCDNSVIISHDTGLYELTKSTVQKIGKENGFWKITKIKDREGLYLASNYNGLYLVEKRNNQWNIKHKITGFEESTRDLLADFKPDTYWVCHGYKGVYKIHINKAYSRVDVVDHFTDKNGFKSPYNINVFKWNDKIVFTTNTGIYFFNVLNNKFELFEPLNKLFDPSKNVRKILQSKDKTWFIQDDEAGYFLSKDQKLNKDLFLNLKGNFNRGMECIYPLSDNEVLFGTNSGIFQYDLDQNQNQQIFLTLINQITYTQNQKLAFVENNSNKVDINLPNQTDILRFEFSSPKMLSSTETNYSYKLENVDENWSPWQKSAFKEYTHLRPGNYTFIVKSRNLAGLVGKEAKFQFTILPKWYQTNLAYLIYLLGLFFLIKYIIHSVKKKIAFERLKSKIEIKKTQQLLELELEKFKLKKDKEVISKDKLNLEVDIIGKSKELANYTLLLSQKKNIFSELQNDLKQLRDLLKSDESRRKITEIFQKLNQHRIGEEYMEIFDVNFEKINHEFFEKLKKIDPSLTKRELRLCAFIKMDLTNKEISPLLNISIRGVETARYKVRKKLKLSHDENFISFLEHLNNQ